MILDRNELEAQYLINQAVGEFNPSRAFIALSGGKDSYALLALARKIMASPSVMSIETGLQTDKWRDMVTLQAHDLRHDIVTGRGFNWYRDNVMAYGFGYTPGHHAVYYRALKQEAIQAHVKANKSHWHDKILYLVGVRKDESVKRAKAPIFYSHGARLTLAPLANWSNDYTRRYAYTHGFSRTWEYERDCMCNWHCSYSVQSLERTSPQLAMKMKAIEDEQVSCGRWRYGRKPIHLPENQLDMFHDMPEDSFCINCKK